jgi:mono/diheme cytochrome c family protein
MTVGCAGQLPSPTTADANRAAQSWPGTTLADLHKGRELYIDRCSGCHSLYVPSTLPASAWPGKVHEMTGRAQLKPAEAEAVIRYLVALTRPEGQKDLALTGNDRAH